MSFEVIGAALIVMLASLSGVIFIQHKARHFLESKLSYLISFSAGVFLVTAGGLALEVFELTESALFGSGLILLGYILAWATHVLLPETHHHHEAECEHSHGVAARKLIVGDAIHNVADGILLVVAFSVSPALGVAATVSIVIHEVLQETAEFFVLRRAGYSIKKALLVNFVVSSTILVGVALGYFALASYELEIALLALSAGFFFHVVIHDLLPKRTEHETGKTFLLQVALVAVGALLMSGVASLLSEGHVHGDGDHGHEHENAHHDGHGHEHEEVHQDAPETHEHEVHDEHHDEHGL